MYDKEKGLYVAHGPNGPISICGKMANRHGLIAGATGTGKTVTLQVLAETFSQAGVPCFMADMKGDLSGISQTGAMSGFIEKRCAEFGITSPEFGSCPVRFFDVFGEQGHPMRTTVSNMGPQLLARLLELNETQTGILNIVFRIADDRGLLLIDMKDLRSMLDYVAKNAKQYTSTYGNITAQSVGAIQRALLTLENQGAEKFFAEPSFDIYDLLQSEQGKGVMNVLAADKLMLNPKLYSTFLLWLLSELYAQLPEVGDMDLPKLVFFFDEAHMLFDETSKALVDKIEQVVRLIRSKGVGVYFITQSPTDIPEDILGQLGNRVQHALRAFTPKDQKAVKTAAETFRENPAFKTAEAIMELGTGEALVSFLDEKGAPSVVERAKILFPLSQIGAVTEGQRGQIINQSRLYGKYDKIVDRESAFEVLMEEAEAAMKAQEEAAQAAEAAAAAEAEEKSARSKKSDKGSGLLKGIFGAMVGAVVTSVTSSIGSEVSKKVTGKKSKTTTKDIAGKALGSAARTATRQLTRSVLGNLVK
jgi:DNA helicase HerA-like ATPase